MTQANQQAHQQNYDHLPAQLMEETLRLFAMLIDSGRYRHEPNDDAIKAKAREMMQQYLHQYDLPIINDAIEWWPQLNGAMVSHQ